MTMLENFFRMVQIPSESGNEKDFLRFTEGLLSNQLHASCSYDSYGNLIATIPMKHSSRSSAVLFGFHGDTVKPGCGIEPILKDGIITSNGATILGADDKAGIAEFIEAVLTVEKHPSLEVVVTREEELGLIGVKKLDFSKLHSEIGFVIDGEEMDAIIVGSPSYMSIDIDITGKASHAGLDPEKGISAIRVGSTAIALLKEGWIDKGTTVNIGTFEGGTIRNGVPEKAIIRAECRSLNHDTCLQQSDLIKNLFSTVACLMGAKVKTRLELMYRATSIDEDLAIVSITKSAISKSGLYPKTMKICGGTEASIYNEHGIPTVDIGTGGKNLHSVDESIAVSDMEKAVQIIRNIFTELS